MTTAVPSRRLRRTSRRARRGVALVSVISVLVLLMIVATPFLLTMRDSARRGERFLYTERADAEAESLFEMARGYLVKGLEHVERRRLDDPSMGGGASGGQAVPDDATPTSDTLSEYQPPAELLRRFNQTSGLEHRVWDLEVFDTQSKFNLNSCSVGVLANLLGRAELSDNLMAGDDRIGLSTVAGLPPKDGTVRIGGEVVRYKVADAATNTLLECERGYRADLPENGGGEEHQKGALVINEAAFQIATRMFRARPGSWVRYTNVYEARAISELGTAALPPQDFDRIRRLLTAWNGNVVGDGWSNPQMVRNNITAGDQTQLYAQIKNLRYFGPGTIVRITDGVNDDYAVVTSVRGTNQVLLAGNVTHDYLADQTRIYSLSRAPINVNTADVETLTVCFEGLGLIGRSNRVTREQAASLAQFLKERKPPADAAGVVGPAGVYRAWQDLVAALEEARDVRSILGAEEFEAVLRNALNACDSNLAFSTVPFTLRSFDVFEARATAALMGAQGQEIARRELRRVFEVATARSSTSVLETQADFQDQIRISRDAKWFVTYPSNVNAFWDQGNEPASEYEAYANRNRFPDTDRSAGAGHLQLREAAFRLTGRNDRTIHFDEEESPEGFDLEKGQLDVSVDAPYSTKERKADLAKYVQIPQRNEETEIGLAPFACSFWYRPAWKPDASEHVIFDYGIGEAAMNRVALRYDPDVRGLVLTVCDATREQRGAAVEFPFDGSAVTWEEDKWYHIACTVYGCSPEMMELFVDGEQSGRAPLLTRLANQVQATGPVTQLTVEDARGFPDSGVLLLRGAEGMELMEYTQRSDTAFTISRRKARTLNHVLDVNQEQPRTHGVGTVVQLYGFAAPLLTDVRRGGASLATDIGPWRVFRVFGTDTGTFTPSGGGAGVIVPPGIAYRSGYQPQVTVVEWTTGNMGDTATLDDLGPQGAEGIAAIVGPTVDISGGNPGTFTVTPSGGGGPTTNDVTIGGMDIVHYRVDTSDTTGLKVTILDRGLRLRHWDADTWVNQAPNGGRFFPSYDYGNTSSIFQISINQQNLPYRGTYTAFVPIALVASGTGGSYLDPADAEPQLGSTSSSGAYTPGSAYVQVDSEWIRYDTYDTTLLSNKACFIRELRLQNLASLFGFVSGSPISPIVSASSGNAGGAGQTSSNNEPPHAIDGNDEATAPAVPATGNQGANLQPPPDNVEMIDIATTFDFRSWEDRANSTIARVANTIARSHSSGAPVVPCFALYSGNEWDLTVMGRRAYGGFDDLITLRDTRGSDEQLRVQWGYGNWVAPTQTPVQSWNWDRPANGNADMRRFPSQAWTRALKFPSGEMPDQMLTQNQEKVRFGRRFDDQGGTTPGIVDELTFHEIESPADDRRDWVFLGEVPSQLYTAPASGTTVQPLRFVGIDETTDSIPVFMPYYDPSTGSRIIQGLPIPAEVFRADGGLVRIDDELIFYSGIDTDGGLLTGCLRGCFNTTARVHQYGAIVIPVETFAMSRLTSPIDESTASFEVADATDFPDDGYLRIGDGLEIAGYTELQNTTLSGPIGRIDPGTGEPVARPGQNPDEKRAGGALFRGRFGTQPAGGASGDVVMVMPWRHYDRYSERSDDPENSYTQFSWTRGNAVWKRITWDELPVKNVEVIGLVRFSGGPPWDSERIVKVGQQALPKEDRRGWLYEITDPKAENLLNVEADRVEVRLMVRFAKGAYDRGATPRPNEWKETPWIQKVVVEYVAPGSVLSQE